MVKRRVKTEEPTSAGPVKRRISKPTTVDSASADPAEVLPKPRGRRKKRRLPCGFCSEVNKKPNHELCPVIIRDADQSTPDKIWRCPCPVQYPDLHPQIREGIQ